MGPHTFLSSLLFMQQFHGSHVLVVEYTFLTRKANVLVGALRSKFTLIQWLLSTSHSEFESVCFDQHHYPAGNPLAECEDLSCEAIRLSRTLQCGNLDSPSSIKWFQDLEDLSHSLSRVGLRKEARHIVEFRREDRKSVV